MVGFIAFSPPYGLGKINQSSFRNSKRIVQIAFIQLTRQKPDFSSLSNQFR